MFLEQAVKPENTFAKYVLGLVLIFLASMIGQIPLSLAVVYKTTFQNKPIPTNEVEIMKLFESNVTLVLVLLSFVFALIALFLVVKYLHKQTITSVTTGRKKIDFGRIKFSFTIWGLFTLVSIALVYFLNPSDFVINFKPIPFLILLLIGTILIPIQTSAEEYIFRGYLMQGFSNLVPYKWFPLLMTSLIFGLLHINNPEVAKTGYIILIYYIGTGLFLGIITLMDDGMELALGFHAANNLFGALLVTSDWSAFQTHSILKSLSNPSLIWDILIPVFLIYPIILIIFKKKFQWKNWKEKLITRISPINEI